MFLKKVIKFAKSKLIVMFVCLFINQTILSEGFLANTLVKIKDGYKQIDQLKENDQVISYSFEDKSLTEGKITKIQITHYKTCIKLTIADKEIIIAPDHKLYCPIHEKYHWIKAKDLKPNDFISSNLTECVRIDSVAELSLEADFYCLTIDKYQNFFVSEQNIFVHNFVLETTIFGIPAILKVSPFLIFSFVYGVRNLLSGSYAKPDDYYISNEKLFGGAALTSGGIHFYQKWTNKQAREEAEKLKDQGLGDWEPDPGVKNQKDPYLPVFRDGKKNKWISPDKDGHGGSIWKLLNRKGDRIGSLDKDLNRIRD